MLELLRTGDWLTGERLRTYPRMLLGVIVIAVAVWIGMSDGLIDPNGKPLGTDFSNVYAAGELTVNDGTGDDVSSGLWIPHSGETFDDNLIVTPGSVTINNSGSEDAHRDANDDGGTTTNNGTDTWYYAVKFTVTDTNLTNDLVNQDYFAHFWGPGFVFRGRAYIANPSLTAGKFAIGLSATSGGLVTKTADID
ncbi:MAG: hypothetical protein IIB62_08600, partial [Proteobacteria bacterium]|nr:hypothetical protein [Pseudomonadota bacterium]